MVRDGQALRGPPVLPEQFEETALPNGQSLLDIDAPDAAVNVGPNRNLICSFVNRLCICPIGSSRRFAEGYQGVHFSTLNNSRHVDH